MHALELLLILSCCPGILGSIMGLIPGLGSAETAPGTNAALSQQQGIANVGKQLNASYMSYLPQATQLGAGNLAFANMTQPYLQQAQLQGFAANTDQGALANAQQEGNYFNSVAANQARQTGLGLTNAGAGSGAIQGATAGAYGNAANESDQAIMQAMSPEAREQRLQQRIGSLYGASNPNLSALQQTGQGLESAVYGQPKDQVGTNNTGALLGNLAGAAIEGSNPVLGSLLGAGGA